MVCHWMSLTVEDEYYTYEGLGMVLGWCMGAFYEDYGTIGSRDPEWIQGDTNVLIEIFRRVGIMSNVAKYKTTTCQLGVTCTGISEEAFSWRIKG